jgi:hypothetical protein
MTQRGSEVMLVRPDFYLYGAAGKVDGARTPSPMQADERLAIHA